ncbi:glycine-rich domain-containing protein [Pseudomonas caspiana]
MTYAYGMQGMPKVGNGLGGLPRRPEEGQGLAGLNPRVIYFQVALGTQLYEILKGETSFYRVTVVGAGGGGGAYGVLPDFSGQIPRAGGGGGGLAASAILPVLRNTTIEFSVGAAGIGGVYNTGSYGPANGTAGGDSTAKFLDNFLVGGGGGRSLDGNTAPGGIGSGGVENHNGGAASITGGRPSSGAGAAGMYHDGDTYNAAFSDNSGGGAGATTINGAAEVSAGGGGAGASGGSILVGSSSAYASIAAGKKKNRGITAIGYPGADGISTSTQVTVGEGGIGGGGGGSTGAFQRNAGNGGVGIVRIELW